MHKPGLTANLRVCVENPAVGQRLKAALRRHAVDGGLMSQTDYRRISGRLGLPSVRALQKQFDRWADVGRWAGLGERVREVSLDRLADAALPEPVPGQRYSEEGVLGVAGWRVLAGWDMWRKRYVPVMAVQVVVLR